MKDIARHATAIVNCTYWAEPKHALAVSLLSLAPLLPAVFATDAVPEFGIAHRAVLLAAVPPFAALICTLVPSLRPSRATVEASALRPPHTRAHLGVGTIVPAQRGGGLRGGGLAMLDVLERVRHGHPPPALLAQHGYLRPGHGADESEDEQEHGHGGDEAQSDYTDSEWSF